MNSEIRKLWVDALLSGAYKQAKGTLRQDGEFCCLGVLCDVLVNTKKIQGEWRIDSAGVGNYVFLMPDDNEDVLWSDDGPGATVLPLDIRELADISCADETVLVTKNDNGESFESIAGFIAEHLTERTKMNPEFKDIWVKALRSGQYLQGTGDLKEGNRFCCLGVLCDVAKERIDGYWSPNHNGGPDIFRTPDFNLTDNGGPEGRTHLPLQVRELTGLDSYAESDLIDLNDHGQGFDYIASYIEGTL